MTKEEIRTIIDNNDFEKLEDIFLHGNDKLKLLALDIITTILANYNHIKNILK